MSDMTFCLPAKVAMSLDQQPDLVEFHLSAIKDDGSIELHIAGELDALQATATSIRVALAG
jgi:hypothetical protein